MAIRTFGCGPQRCPPPGTYLIRTDGPMGGYVNPQLAFGRDTQYDWLTGVSAGVLPGLGGVVSCRCA